MSEQNTTASSETSAPEVEVKLTPRERLVAKYEKLAAKVNSLSAELNAIAAEIHTIDALAQITVGTPVIVGLGKGETAKDVEAVVVGVKEEEDGTKVYKVAYGTGFDADVAVVKANRIKLAPATEPVAE